MFVSLWNCVLCLCETCYLEFMYWEVHIRKEWEWMNACSAAACLLWLCFIEVQLFAAALWQQRIPNLQCYQFESSSSSLETNSHRQSILLFKTVFIQAIPLAVDPLKACFVLICCGCWTPPYGFTYFFYDLISLDIIP